MASYIFLFLLSLLLLLPSISSNITTIPLSHFHRNPHPHPHLHPSHHLNNLATSSLKRAHHLKNPQTTTTHRTTTPVFSQSYGGYSIPLSFGTPPQTLSFIMDTGSHFTWFPCTKNYQCVNCPSYLKPFIPKLSSSSKILGCSDSKCALFHNKSPRFHCQACRPNSKNCTQMCPAYTFVYGLGETTGVPLSETLDLPTRSVPDFLVGCSVSSTHQPPAGIAGLGRGPASLPAQLGFKKFSYCLLSRLFDDTNKSSLLVLDAGEKWAKKTTGVIYTPFVSNPLVPARPAFSVYYYVGLRQIKVGRRRVKIPYRYLRPDSRGSGGTIIDSGTTFTIMAPEVSQRVSGEFARQMAAVGYKRAEEVEAVSGLKPCYSISGAKSAAFPAVTFHFKGGAEVALPVENYMAIAGDDLVCLTIMSDKELGGPEVSSSGPSIIIGSFQLQNFYVEYDLLNERLGFRQQRCN
ncbi:probable aspartyl protease At4g16563 [Pyrus x bretschneideri]|uniref:probable aspartyl protease At4g16563 n=1 Tax=Pyrus x bretschneideri TaxID=225117 RepID=UPI00202F7B43|nr:probable aspartyl protease At4g16563 [Pyrus x bretschneideri]